MKLLPLTLVLLSTLSNLVLADKKLQYTCYNYHHTIRADILFMHKSGGVIGDAFAEEIVKHMPEWSDHKYTAKYDLWTKSAVYIGCSNQEPSKDEAVEALKDQEKIVKEHIREG